MMNMIQISLEYMFFIYYPKKITLSMSIKGMNNIIKISSVKIILELYEFTKIKPKKYPQR